MKNLNEFEKHMYELTNIKKFTSLDAVAWLFWGIAIADSQHLLWFFIGLGTFFLSGIIEHSLKKQTGIFDNQDENNL